MKRIGFVLMTAVVLAAFRIILPNDCNAIEGVELAQRVFDRDDGRDASATVKLLLIDDRGDKKFRTLTTAVKEYGKTLKTYMRFTSPADIDGTSFLTWENEDRDDDQFLYLPALKRVRRIVSTQKDSRFVNTDYTYEDLQRRKVALDNHRILSEDNVGEYPCFVLESIPIDEDESQYGKRISYIIKDRDMPAKIEFYDKRGHHVKTYWARKIEKIDGIWSVAESEMQDLKNNRRTLMKTTEIRYNQGIEDNVFTEGYMMHQE
jgi:hypothetical protein